MPARGTGLRRGRSWLGLTRASSTTPDWEAPWAGVCLAFPQHCLLLLSSQTQPPHPHLPEAAAASLLLLLLLLLLPLPCCPTAEPVPSQDKDGQVVGTCTNLLSKALSSLL